jgi:cytoskeleton protein RodZ
MSFTERLKANLLCTSENGGRLHLREISDAADEVAISDCLGAALRAARRRQNIGVETVSEDLKIRKRYIKALEDSDFETLPTFPYALGFVRSYADYLGLDAVQCMRCFKEELPSRADKKAYAFPEARKEVRLPQGSMLVLAVLLAAGIYGGWYLSVQADRMVMSRVPPVPDRLAEQTGANNGLQSRVDGARQEVPSASGLNSAIGGPAIQFSGSQGQISLSAGGTNVASAPDQSASEGVVSSAAETAAQDAVATNARIVLRVRSTAWMRVEDSESRVLIQRELQSGETYDVPNRPGLILSVRDAGAVEVLVDGQDLGTLGQVGQPLPAVLLDPLSLKLSTSS